MNARAFMNALSTAGMNSLREPVKPEPVATPKTCCVDRWNGSRWISVDLVWDGEKYVEVK